ncbi:MAG: MauE/DoxX family redox-associated membrane protein [Bacteroidota bacterium]
MKNKAFPFFFYLMILLYILAGINHFVKPEFYRKIMPFYIPCHDFCIYLSGLCEIIFAILLIPKATRKAAALLIIAMLIVFFIIHIQMLIDCWDNDDVMFLVAIIRIPIQFILIWWAWLYTKNPRLKS